MYRKSIILIFLNLLAPYTIFAQADSTENIKQTNFTPALRIGAGFTPGFYLEAGIALHKFRSNPPNSISHNIYSAVEATTTLYGDRGFLLLAPKVGYQFSAIFYAIGFETKYLSDGKNRDVVIAFKAGLSLLGVANLMYGYQISFNNYPFPNMGAHQFGIAFTLYKNAFRGGRK